MNWWEKLNSPIVENVAQGFIWIAAAVFLVGMAFAAVYLGSLEQPFQLSALEIFFVATTIASLGLNLFQHVKTKSVNRPLLNHLVGVFNDIKSKQQTCWGVNNNLWLPQNPHQDVATLRWEYAGFALMLTNSFQQLQEAIVAAIVTLDPSDPAGNRAFRAQEYGLTKPEREFRAMQQRQFLSSQESTREQIVANATSSQPPKPESDAGQPTAEESPDQRHPTGDDLSTGDGDQDPVQATHINPLA